MHQPPLLPPPPPRAAMEEKGRSVLHSGLSDHSLGPEVLREMLLARMEDPDYLDAATRREAERRVEKVGWQWALGNTLYLIKKSGCNFRTY